MDYIIKIGTHFEVEVGTPEEPEITRWTSWGLGDLQQSFLLHTSEGTLMVDPVLPQLSESLKAIKQRAGRVQAILSLSPLHERHIAEAARRYRAPVYGPPAAKTTTQYGRKLGVRYGSGQPLPGGVQTIESGDDNGEMWLYWKTPKGKKVLINADTIYGQNEAGGMGGRNVSYWMQEKGIRLRATGALSRNQMRRRYERLDALDIDLVLNGHNPLPLKEPKVAISEVLTKGRFEVHPSGICTFIYMDFT
jgi:hypothetical protein